MLSVPAMVSLEGKLQLTGAARRSFDDGLRLLVGKPILISVTEERATRSASQNAWYWGVIMARLSDRTGYTPDELHEYCKQRFLSKHLAIANDNGEIVDDRVIGGSTTKLTTKAFGEYCELIRQWAAAELGLDIPDPITVAA